MLTLDIVIVNHNSGAMLKTLLQSIEHSITARISIRTVTVVDNRSNDDSARRLRHRLPLIVLHSNQNMGYGAACNLGAQQSCAQYILFLNPDILLSSDSLEMACTSLSAHPECASLGVRLCNVDGSLQNSKMILPTYRHMLARSSGLHRLFPKRFPTHFCQDQYQSGIAQSVLGAFLLVRRAAFCVINGFDEAFFLYYEEIDLIHRLHNKGYRCMYNSAICVKHVGGACSRHSTTQRYNSRSRVLYARRYFTAAQARLVKLGCTILEPPLRFFGKFFAL